MSDFRSRVLGTIIGILSRGSFPKWEPVAFLYNGVRLPGLPVVEGYDYSCVAKDIEGDIYWAFVRSEAEKLIITIADGNRFTGSKKGYKLVDSVWEEATSYLALDPIWANYDIVNPNGELVLEASAPVPVYE